MQRDIFCRQFFCQVLRPSGLLVSPDEDPFPLDPLPLFTVPCRAQPRPPPLRRLAELRHVLPHPDPLRSPVISHQPSHLQAVGQQTLEQRPDQFGVACQPIFADQLLQFEQHPQGAHEHAASARTTPPTLDEPDATEQGGAGQGREAPFPHG